MVTSWQKNLMQTTGAEFRYVMLNQLPEVQHLHSVPFSISWKPAVMVGYGAHHIPVEQK
jgi:hypothetical protein